MVAEAFTALWQTIETGAVRDPAGLLHSIAEGLAIDSFRKSHRESLRQEKLENLGALRPVGSQEPSTFLTDFDRAVRAVPEPERASFILTELRGLTEREAAGVLGLSHMTVNRRAANARLLVREALT